MGEKEYPCCSMLQVSLSEPSVDRIFYDGDCALCHGAVRFVVRRLPSECAFRFAPLAGSTFLGLVSEALREGLPDSLVVQTSSGELLLRSSAAIYILNRLGGGWKWVAKMMSVVPRPLADAVYDWIARNRFRFFARPETNCPIIPQKLKRCFDP